jgi:hypothetical protein
VPKVLELAKFVEEDGVTEMEVRCGRVEASFDAEALAFSEALPQLGLDQKLVGASLYDGERVLY